MVVDADKSVAMIVNSFFKDIVSLFRITVAATIVLLFLVDHRMFVTTYVHTHCRHCLVLFVFVGLHVGIFAAG